MDRRAFLRAGGTALAAAFAPSLGCRTIGGPDLGGAEGSEEDFVASMKARVARLREADPDSAIRNYLAERGHRRGLMEEAAAALLVSATFRDLPPRSRRHPAVQAWVKDELPNMARALFELADFMDGLDARERREISALLRRDPAVGREVKEAFELRTRAAGAGPERAAQGGQVLDHVVWRTQHQSADAVISEYVDRLDKECAREGFERSRWRELLAEEERSWPELSLAPVPERVEEVEGTACEALGPPLPVSLGLVVEETLDRGLEVVHVRPGGPADGRGIAPGDRVVELDGWDLPPGRARKLLEGRKPGDRVELTLARGSDVWQETVRLEPDDEPLVPAAPAIPAVGRLSSSKHRVIRASATVLAVGAVIAGSGLTIFLIGLAAISTPVGMGMTIVGAIIVLAGLFVILIAGLVAIGEAMSRSRPRPEPRELPEGDPL